eukprot:7144798-Karenia_brevis.AAC.1
MDPDSTKVEKSNLKHCGTLESKKPCSSSSALGIKRGSVDKGESMRSCGESCANWNKKAASSLFSARSLKAQLLNAFLFLIIGMAQGATAGTGFSENS